MNTKTISTHRAGEQLKMLSAKAGVQILRTQINAREYGGQCVIPAVEGRDEQSLEESGYKTGYIGRSGFH